MRRNEKTKGENVRKRNVKIRTEQKTASLMEQETTKVGTMMKVHSCWALELQHNPTNSLFMTLSTLRIELKKSLLNFPYIRR